MPFPFGGIRQAATPVSNVPGVAYVIRTDGAATPSISATSPFGALSSFSALGDAGAVLQFCLNAIGSAGGGIVFSRGVYPFTTIPAFAPGTTRWTEIFGDGATIQLSSSAQRFLDFNRTADHQLFNLLRIRDLIFDASALTGNTTQPIILGNIASQLRVRLSHIEARRLIGTGAPVIQDGVNSRAWIFLSSQQPAGEGTQDFVTDIVLEDLDFSGGNTGAFVGANSGGGGNLLNIACDRVSIKRLKHDTGVTLASVVPGAGIQVGQSAQLGRVTIEDCDCRGNPDVNYEVDGPSEGVIADCVGWNPTGASFLIAAFNNPLWGTESKFTFEKITHRRTVTQGANNGYGFSIGDGGGGLVLGDIEVDHYTFIDEVGTQNTLFNGMVVNAKQGGTVPFRHVTFRSPRVQVACNVSGAADFGMMWFTPAGSQKSVLRIEDFVAVLTGARSAGAFTYTPVVLRSSVGRVELDIDGVWIDDNVTTPTTGGCRVIDLGGAATVYGGFVRRFGILNTADTAPFGLNARQSNSGSTITPCLVVEGADFTVVGAGGAGQEILSSFLTNPERAKIFMVDNTLVGGALTAPVTNITVGASAFLYQSLSTGTHGSSDFADAFITVQGGTVTKIEYSVDGVTFIDTGVIQGAFRVNNGHYLRVTYTVAPTMKRIPVRR